MSVIEAGTMADVAVGLLNLDDLELNALLEREARRQVELKPTRTRERLAAELEWANRQAWPGRSGTTDRLTYTAVVNTAIAANELTVGMSRYTLSEFVGIAPATAYRSLERHVRQGRLLRHPPASIELASRYEVVLRNETRRNPSQGTVVSSLVMQQPVHDAFRTRQGLSKTALLVIEALDFEHPQTAAELARKIGKHRSTIGRILSGQLFSAGLALETSNGWLRTDASLDELAVDLGTSGAAERTRKRNAEQRELYRLGLERGMKPRHWRDRERSFRESA